MTSSPPSASRRFVRILSGGIGCVWIFHGLYSKLADGIPRHQMIVGRVMGEEAALWITPVVGVLEICLGVWFFVRFAPALRALTQTIALVSMNALEIAFAYDLLLHPPGMVAANLTLIAAGWYVARAGTSRL